MDNYVLLLLLLCSFKGFEGFTQTKEARKRQKTNKGEERLFSLSSKSSPVVRLFWRDPQAGPMDMHVLRCFPPQTRDQEQAALQDGMDGLSSPAGFGKKVR